MDMAMEADMEMDMEMDVDVDVDMDMEAETDMVMETEVEVDMRMEVEMEAELVMEVEMEVDMDMEMEMEMDKLTIECEGIDDISSRYNEQHMQVTMSNVDPQFIADLDEADVVQYIENHLLLKAIGVEEVAKWLKEISYE